jgi:hypothetical protein
VVARGARSEQFQSRGWVEPPKVDSALLCAAVCLRFAGREGREAPVILRQDDSRPSGLPDRYCSAACKVINTAVPRRESSPSRGLHRRIASPLRMLRLIGKELQEQTAPRPLFRLRLRPRRALILP